MRAIRRTSQFKRDVKRMKRRGKNLQELKKVIESLAGGRKLRRNTETTCSLGDTEVRASVISHQIGC